MRAQNFDRPLALKSPTSAGRPVGGIDTARTGESTTSGLVTCTLIAPLGSKKRKGRGAVAERAATEQATEMDNAITRAQSQRVRRPRATGVESGIWRNFAIPRSREAVGWASVLTPDRSRSGAVLPGGSACRADELAGLCQGLTFAVN